MHFISFISIINLKVMNIETITNITTKETAQDSSVEHKDDSKLTLDMSMCTQEKYENQLLLFENDQLVNDYSSKEEFFQAYAKMSEKIQKLR